MEDKESYRLALNDIKKMLGEMYIPDDVYAREVLYSAVEFRKGFDYCRKRLLDMIGEV